MDATDWIADVEMRRGDSREVYIAEELLSLEFLL